ncbi:MAG: pyruvate, water dikinase regulatory protein [Deltaproteobacteria bacterium]|nr:pyruvate, water dikinase regulatory protein [Deltaproteobacteria bacterium]
MSDSTGETAERVVRAALLQFPEQKVRIRFHARIRDRDAARSVIEACARDGGLLVFTIVSPELREFVHQVCYEKKVESVDVIGAMLGKLSSFLDSAPLGLPSVSLPLSEEYFRRIEAVEFAVKNDDGKEPRNLRKADLVLVGVSRTSKTPLSTYLANRGIKVANVPLVLGVPLPAELSEIPQDRVVALTIGLDQLLDIRRERLRQLGMPADTNYGLREHVQEELDFAQSIYRSHPQWPVIEVTGRAIEETAVIIMDLLKERGRALY